MVNRIIGGPPEWPRWRSRPAPPAVPSAVPPIWPLNWRTSFTVIWDGVTSVLLNGGWVLAGAGPVERFDPHQRSMGGSDGALVQNAQGVLDLGAPVVHLLVGGLVVVDLAGAAALVTVHRLGLVALVVVGVVVGVLDLARPVALVTVGRLGLGQFRHVGALHLVGPRLQFVGVGLQLLGRVGVVAESVLDVLGALAALLSQFPDLVGGAGEDALHVLGGLDAGHLLHGVVGDPLGLRVDAVGVVPDVPRRVGRVAVALGAAVRAGLGADVLVGGAGLDLATVDGAAGEVAAEVRQGLGLVGLGDPQEHGLAALGDLLLAALHHGGDLLLAGGRV